mmetsp:Transcript_4826/g.12404  ORF Transcript_4826/g.12404 Transcript_4826/m.12404 type:complete len:202 (+) Transcript_4826:67-672(+)
MRFPRRDFEPRAPAETSSSPPRSSGAGAESEEGGARPLRSVQPPTSPLEKAASRAEQGKAGSGGAAGGLFASPFYPPRRRRRRRSGPRGSADAPVGTTTTARICHEAISPVWGKVLFALLTLRRVAFHGRNLGGRKPSSSFSSSRGELHRHGGIARNPSSSYPVRSSPDPLVGSTPQRSSPVSASYSSIERQVGAWQCGAA